MQYWCQLTVNLRGITVHHRCLCLCDGLQLPREYSGVPSDVNAMAQQRVSLLACEVPEYWQSYWIHISS
jgi:hypothetical protein